MNNFVILVFASILLTLPAPSHSGAVLCDQNCASNEIYSRCTGPNQRNCWARNLTIADEDCVTGCVCAPRFIRDPNTYLCIPEDKCPPLPKPWTCPLNEVYSKCNAGCQKTCDTLNVAFKCKCVPGCVCKNGYVRSQISGKCIPIEDCSSCPPGYKRDVGTGKCEFCCQECPENEEYSECGTACERGCFVQNQFCILLCKRGCFCKEGYVRAPTTGACIPKEWCPKCGPNETFSCGNSLCEKTCKNFKKTCKIQPIRCEDKCYCNTGYVRDANGACIPASKCGLIAVAELA